ncbi:MAG: DUF4404 family protein [Pseudohongiellaceae bacterium]
MSEERLKALVTQLVAEMENTRGVDPESLARARKLRADIEDVVNPAVDTEEYSVLDDAIALEASFAARHPVAERMLRELINNLSRIGI